MPAARYSACEISWPIWGKAVVSACGVVPVSAIVPAFPSIGHTYRHYEGPTIGKTYDA